MFPFCPEIKSISKDDFNEYIKKLNQKIINHTKKLICDWTDEKKYLIQYRMLSFYVRHGVVFHEVHDRLSFNQSNWLEIYTSFDTQKRNQAVNDFERDFYNLINKAFYGKTMDKVRKRCTMDFIKKDEIDNIINIIKQQSKLAFNGIHESYENRDSYTFKQNEALLDQPIYLGFAMLELSMLHMYETYSGKLESDF